MSLADYNRNRSNGTLGLASTSDATDMGWRSHVRNSSAANTYDKQPSTDSENDSDGFNFEAYKQKRFPNATTESVASRSSSALGMASTAAYASNDNLSTAQQAERRRTANSTSTNQGNATGSKLKSLLQRQNNRSTAGTSRTPGPVNGRISTTQSKVTPPQAQTQVPNSKRVSPTDHLQLHRASPKITEPPRSDATIKPSERGSLEVNTAAKRPTSVPPKGGGKGNDSSSSEDDDFMSDDERLAVGLAARKQFRVLTEKLEALQAAFKKDPRNQGLSPAQMEAELEKLELEDMDDRLLYKELWEYVRRNGQLGPHWEKHIVHRKKTAASDDEILLALNSGRRSMSDKNSADVHDAAEAGDLAPLEVPLQSRPVLAHLRTSSIDVPPGPGSANAAPAYASSPDAQYPPRTSTVGAGITNKPQGTAIRTEEDEDDVPLPQGRFEKLALNDTLQLRHHQLSQTGSTHTAPATLPPSAVIYEPPPPRSTKTRRRSPSGATQTTMRASTQSTAPDRESQILEKRRSANQTAPTLPPSSRSRTGSSQTLPSQPIQPQPQRLDRSASRRKKEPSGDDRRGMVGNGISRPGSSKSAKPEEEPSDAYESNEPSPYEQPNPGQYAPLSRSGLQQPPASYPDVWQSQSHTPYAGNQYESMGPPMSRGPPPAQMMMHGGYMQHSYGQQGYSQMDPNRYPYGAGMPIGATPGNTDAQAMRGSYMPNNSPQEPPLQERSKDTTYIQVNGHQYQRLELIGKGGSSRVYRVLRCKDNKQFALKKVELQSLDEESMRGYTEEIKMLKRLSGNKSIVSLIDDELRGKGSGTLYLVMELGEIDFARLLVERQGTPIYLPWITMYFKQMLESVNIIHEERIVHSDLKPANFVLMKGMLKLIDFGIAKAIANDTTNIHRESQVGTINYMSPEAVDSTPDDEKHRKVGRASDVWSLGCILYQMVYGSPPFAALSFQQKAIAIMREDYAIPFPEYAVPVIPKERSGTGRPEPQEHLKVKVPKELVATMKACLHRDSKQRPTISQLLEEPWLNGFYAIDNPTTKAPKPQLSEDQAIVSGHYLAQLLSYVIRCHDPSWDPEAQESVKWLEDMSNTIMPQLRDLDIGNLREGD